MVSEGSVHGMMSPLQKHHERGAGGAKHLVRGDQEAEQGRSKREEEIRDHTESPTSHLTFHSDIHPVVYLTSPTGSSQGNQVDI